MPTYKCWHEGREAEEDAVVIQADTPSGAAEHWVETGDPHNHGFDDHLVVLAQEDSGREWLVMVRVEYSVTGCAITCDDVTNERWGAEVVPLFKEA